MTGTPLAVGIARFTLPGEILCGDQCHVSQDYERALIGVIDGLGHGTAAAAAADAATAQLASANGRSLSQLMAGCHERLRATRGAAMTLISLDMKARQLEWIGVGNVVAVLLHPLVSGRVARTQLFGRGGVVGAMMPATSTSGTSFAPGDMIVAATDGVDIGFIDDISGFEPPQKLAERLLQRHRSGDDDALVLVACIQRVDP
jgi:hypothetical protein